MVKDKPPFRKILIANRGEIAVRIIRACRELGISPIAVYSEADRQAKHVRLADEAYCIGDAPSRESYLCLERILEAARRAQAEAIHPGYGFLAENAHFAQACQDAGFVFIGPSPASMKLMGDKLASRIAVRQAGVPVIPGTEKGVGSLEEALAAARSVGFPLMLKASAGGGGKGLRLVENEQQLASVFQSAQGEALSAFGDGTLYLERYLRRPRHVEVQLLGDQEGRMIHLGERECSLQRRHQKLLEEAPSPLVQPQLRRRLGEAAIRVGQAAAYSNAGTVEFLVQEGPQGEPEFYFLEMNTRLQVEHPVTELVTGIDLVHEQIWIAAGHPLRVRQEDVHLRGWAMECRVYAEDPLQNFLPSPGRIGVFEEPSGPGVRHDSGVESGSEITTYYDPLISKLITYGEDRAQAVARLRRALGEFKISGVQTTLPLFQFLCNFPPFLAGSLHTGFLEEHRVIEGMLQEWEREVEVPLLAAALDHLERTARQRPRFSPSGSWRRAVTAFHRDPWQRGGHT